MSFDTVAIIFGACGILSCFGTLLLINCKKLRNYVSLIKPIPITLGIVTIVAAILIILFPIFAKPVYPELIQFPLESLDYDKTEEQITFSFINDSDSSEEHTLDRTEVQLDVIETEPSVEIVNNEHRFLFIYSDANPKYTIRIIPEEVLKLE